MTSIALLSAFAAILVAGAGAIANESTHGQVAEGMGLGHQHMLDYGGYHCTSHEAPNEGPHHIEHMHEQHPANHASCPGGQRMHEQHTGMT